MLYANKIRPHGTERSCRGQRLSISKPLYLIGNLPAAKVRTFSARGTAQLGRTRENEGVKGIFSRISPFNLCRDQNRSLELIAKHCSIATTKRRNIATTKRCNIATTKRRNIATTKHCSIATTKRRSIATTKRRSIATTKRRNIATTKRHNIATTKRRNIATTKRCNIATTIQ